MYQELPQGKVWKEKDLLFDQAETFGFGYDYYSGPKTDMRSNSISYIIDNFILSEDYESRRIPCREKTCNDF